MNFFYYSCSFVLFELPEAKNLQSNPGAKNLPRNQGLLSWICQVSQEERNTSQGINKQNDVRVFQYFDWLVGVAKNTQNMLHTL